MDIVCLYVHIFDCMHVLYVFMYVYLYVYMYVYVSMLVHVCMDGWMDVGRRMNGIMFKDVIPFSMNTREQP